MKIEYLEIKNYKQFTDLTLDLTYPKGHEKEGQPLDKICIIGQSGTGKTNLLEIIKKSTVDFSEQSKNSYLPFSEFIGDTTDNRYITTKFKIQKKIQVETLFTDEISKITFIKQENQTIQNSILLDEKNYFVSTVRCSKEENDDLFAYEFDISKMNTSDKRVYDRLVNAKAELVLESINEDKKDKLTVARENMISHYHGGYGLDGSRKKTVLEKRRELQNEIDNLEDKYTSISEKLNILKQENFIDKSIININEENNSWNLLKERINNYEIDKNNYIKHLSNKILHDDNYSKKDFKTDITLWENENENILEKIADDINIIIKKFNLELKIDENTQSYEELIIKDLSSNTIIDYDDLSTGTKNLLSTFIPLKSYKPKDSIILIDEPEMSFYPDIQKQLIDLYTSVGTNNQLVVATHSPLIASSFEPWEVVELKFDKNNQICREKYYEGENHIDNYTLDPRMLTWTGILTDIFDMKEDSNFTVREKKLMEYATLKAEIKVMDNIEEKEEAFKELKKISKLLGLYN